MLKLEYKFGKILSNFPAVFFIIFITVSFAPNFFLPKVFDDDFLRSFSTLWYCSILFVWSLWIYSQSVAVSEVKWQRGAVRFIFLLEIMGIIVSIPLMYVGAVKFSEFTLSLVFFGVIFTSLIMSLKNKGGVDLTLFVLFLFPMIGVWLVRKKLIENLGEVE